MQIIPLYLRIIVSTVVAVVVITMFMFVEGQLGPAVATLGVMTFFVAMHYVDKIGRPNPP